MKDEIKEILIKDFNEILVKEFCIDYKEKRLYVELLVNATPFTNLLNYITNLQKENEELKMTNLALVDDITKNKIIKQEVLTECCGIPIGEIPMLKIQNDEYKQRIDKATEKLETLMPICIMPNNTLIHGTEKAKTIEETLNILQGSDE